MTFNKVNQLAEKLQLKTAQYNRNELYQAERNRLDFFFSQLSSQFTAILNEMEGDLLTLKHKGFAKGEFKDDFRNFLKLFYQLIKLGKSLNEYKPYEAAQKIVDITNSRAGKAYINDLNLTTQDFLANHEVDWGQPLNDKVRQATLDSLNKLLAFGQQLHNYMADHPLISDIATTPTVDARVIADPEFKEVGPEEVTKVEKN